MSHVYVERADPDAKGYEEGSRRWFNVGDRYRWADKYTEGVTLDVPCGMGWGASYIRNASVLIGLDNSPEALNRGAGLYQNIIFVLGDMLKMDFPNNFFDTVICCEGYEHVKRKDQFRLMDEIHRVVKPDGFVLLTVPIAEKEGKHSRNEFHLYEPTIHEVKETIDKKFTVISMIKPNVARYVLKAVK